MSSTDTRYPPAGAVANLLTRIAALAGPAPEPPVVVLVAVDAHQEIATALRLDLRADAGPAQPDPEALALSVAALHDADTTGVVVAGYGPAALVEPAAGLISRAVAAAGLPVCAAVRIADDRYWPLPPHAGPDTADTRAIPFPPQHGTAAPAQEQALAALLAPVTLADRNAVTASTIWMYQVLMEIFRRDRRPSAPRPATPGADRAESLAATLEDISWENLVASLPDWLATIADGYRSGQPTDDTAVGMLTVLLVFGESVAVAADQATGQPWQLTMWSDLARRAAGEYASEAAVLLAVCAQRAGCAALARAAADRAVAVNPERELAQTARRAVLDGIDLGDLIREQGT